MAQLTLLTLDDPVDQSLFTINGNFTALNDELATKAALNHAHDASAIVSGIFPPGRLGTGTPDNTKFLRGDGAWSSIQQSQWVTGSSGAIYYAGGTVSVGTSASTARLFIRNDNDMIGALQVNRGDHLLLAAYYNSVSGKSEFVFGNGTGGVASVINGDGVASFRTLDLGPVAQTPVAPPASANANVYVRNGKLVIQYNDAGTTRYKWLDLFGTGTTWQHSTTAP